MKCINISHPEYQKRLKQAQKYGYNPSLFAMESAIWQSRYNTDEFPSYDMLDPDLSNLITFVEKSGIRLESLDWWQEVTGNKLADNVEALADPLRKVIAYKKGTLTKEQLAEEIVHIMLAHSEYSKDPEFEKILKYVEKTEEYRENYSTYLEAYKGDSVKAKKEILHKIGADVLLRNQKVPKGTLLMRYLRSLWEKFLSLFDPRKKLEYYLQSKLDKVDMTAPIQDKDVYYSLAIDEMQRELKEGKIVQATKKDLLDARKKASTPAEQEEYNEFLQVIDDQPIYRRVDKNQITRFFTEESLKTYMTEMFVPTILIDPEFKRKIKRIKSILNKKLKSILKNPDIKKSDFRIKYIKDQLQVLDQEDNSLERGLGLANFIEHVVRDSQTVLSKLKSSSEKLTDKDLNDIMEFYETYKPLLRELSEYLSERQGVLAMESQRKGKPRERKDMPKVSEEELLTLVQEALDEFTKAESSFNWKLQELAIDTVRKMWADELGISMKGRTSFQIDSLINAQLYNQSIDEEKGNDYKDVIKGNKDISSIARIGGIARFSGDPILRIVNSELAYSRTKTTGQTVNFAKKFFDRVRSYGFTDFDFAMEKDDKGKLTGFMISEYNHGLFEKRRLEKTKELAAKYQIPTDETDKREFFERMADISKVPEDSLLESQKKEKARFKAYKKEWTEWANKNTQARPDAELKEKQIKKKATDTNNPLLYEMWKQKNKGSYYSPDGELIEYWKGDMIMPSDKYKNPEYDKLSDKQKEFIKYYMKVKKMFDRGLPHNPHEQLLIPIREDLMSVALHRNKHSLFSKDSKQRVAEGLKSMFLEDEDDTLLFGDPESVRELDNDFLLRTAPIHHVKRLKDPNTISRDLVGAMVEYARTYYNYANKKNVLTKMQVIEQQYRRRTLEREGKKIRGTESNIYELLKTTLDINASDAPRKKKVLKNFLGLGIDLNVTKVVDIINRYTVSTNLLANLRTMFSSTTTSRIKYLQESLMNYYLPKETIAEGREIFHLELGRLGMDGINKAKRAKLNVMAEHAGVIEMTSKYDRSFLLRDNMLWAGYTLPSNMLAMQTLLTFALEVRKDKDGNWVRKRNYKGKDWKDLPRLYDHLTVSKEGKLVIPKGAEKQWARISIRTRDFIERIEGKLNPENKTFLHQHYLLVMLTLHRSYVFRVLHDRLKKGGYDPIVGHYDEGYWRSAFISDNKITFKKFGYLIKGAIARNAASLEMWNQLSDAEKYGVKTFMADLIRSLMLALLAGLVHGMADDEDEWAMQMLSSVVNQTAAELSFEVPPFNIPELVTVFQNPIVAFKYVDYITNYTDLFSSEEVTRGPYQGYSKRQKFLLRLIPVVKGLFNTSDPEAANKFLRTKQLKFIPWEWFEE